MEVIVAERQGSDREVVAERSRRQNSDRRKTNWQRGQTWATSVLANAKSEPMEDTFGRARRRGMKVEVLTRGDLLRESAGEVSRGRSSEEARRKTGRAKGRRNQERSSKEHCAVGARKSPDVSQFPLREARNCERTPCTGAVRPPQVRQREGTHERA